MRTRRLAAAVLATLAWMPSARADDEAVEYWHAGFDHYFLTAVPAEMKVLDSGQIAGWIRTGQRFAVNEGSSFPELPPFVSRVCRFYLPPEHGDSHFFSASPAECAQVLAKIGVDPNYSGYVYETPQAFTTYLPDAATGACPVGIPIYRLWNARADSNHRLTADPATKTAMHARGYVAEGYGPDAVAMCAVHARNDAAQSTVSAASPFAPGCERVVTTGTAYVGWEVEPMIAVDPRDAAHLVAIWQQDRWSNGGARGVLTAVSHDAGATWTTGGPPFSRCTGGTVANGGDYPRVSNPWIAFGADGTVHAIAIAFAGGLFGAGSTSAIVASRSRDGGATWSNAATLIRDTGAAFNDKDAVTGDPTDARYAYAVWDRLQSSGHGPSYFARTVDEGATWEAARPIYDPGNDDQTINNQIVVASDGSLVDFFTLINNHGNDFDVSVAIVRSTDRGSTWSDATIITRVLGVGTHDPDTGLPIRDGTFCGSIAAGPNGLLVAVFQDARFSNGARDGIAMVRSTDYGATWSAPVQVNLRPDVQALLPAVAIRADGTIGITYYDLRSNTPDPATLPVENWLVESDDGGATWRETHVAGPFDLAAAPVTDAGHFLGDYQALLAVGDRFVAAYTTTSAANGQSDIVATVGRRFGAAAAAAPPARRAASLAVTPLAPPTATFVERVQANTRRALAARGRLPGH